MRDESQQNSTPPSLRPVQARVIAEIAQGRTITAAAQAAEIDRSTVYLWKSSDPTFAAALCQAQCAYVEALNAEVRGLAADAVAAVREIITSPQTPAAVRLKAARDVLNAAGALAPPRSTGSPDPEECRLLIEHHRQRRNEARAALRQRQPMLGLR
ncbi:MAG: helix-turn-helix domain-containing protein [Acidobacteria bacterium]|nr:helix-turn-helix domain-containing protein [Acidobacteriota bacterium]